MLKINKTLIRGLRSVAKMETSLAVKKPKEDKQIIQFGNISKGPRLKSFKVSDKNFEKNFMLHGKSGYLNENLEDEDPESLIKYEKDLDLYATNENLYHKKQIEEDIKKRKKMKMGIIKKKIEQIENRREVNFNLLTWDAKEQIKHLHLKEPEVWTPERISESFPITIESCKKLLRSSWIPKTLDELARHDEKVMQNWKLLTEIENNPNLGGPAINIYQEYKKMNKLNLLKHAAGIPGISFERKSHIFSDSYALHESLLCKPGTFSSIIKHRDNKVKEIFKRDIKQEEELKLKQSEQNKESNMFKEHLTMTKSELSKSLTKIFPKETKSKS